MSNAKVLVPKNSISISSSNKFNKDKHKSVRTANLDAFEYII